MDEDTAKALIECLKELNSALNRLSSTSEGISEEAIRLEYRKALGGVMVDVDAMLIRPIEHRFPHLKVFDLP